MHSATLTNPQNLEAVILSRNAGQIAAVGGSFTAVYTPCRRRRMRIPRNGT